MSGLELYILIENFFGNKVEMSHCNQRDKEVGCILHESFYLSCNLNGQDERFEAEIALGKEAVLTEFLGRRCLPDVDEKSIQESLQIIDDYCRLRLPDKFLEAYETGQKIKKNLSSIY